MHWTMCQAVDSAVLSRGPSLLVSLSVDAWAGFWSAAAAADAQASLAPVGAPGSDPWLGLFPSLGPFPLAGALPGAGPLSLLGSFPSLGPFPLAGALPVAGVLPLAGILPLAGLHSGGAERGGQATGRWGRWGGVQSCGQVLVARAATVVVRLLYDCCATGVQLLYAIFVVRCWWQGQRLRLKLRLQACVNVMWDAWGRSCEGGLGLGHGVWEYGVRWDGHMHVAMVVCSRACGHAAYDVAVQ